MGTIAGSTRLLRLDGPISTPNAGLPVQDVLDELDDVQGNILQAHGRRFALHVLLRFSRPTSARQWLAEIAPHLTTAADEVRGRAARGELRRVFLSLALGAGGLRVVGLNDPDPSAALVRAGMAGRRRLLADPAPDDWDRAYREGVDAMLVIADDDPGEAWSTFRALFANEPLDGVDVTGVEVGQRLTNEFGQDIEHFGYVDGTSQPLFFESDVDRELRRQRSLDWSPGFPPRQVLVPCRGGGYGSYLVYRKLEQNLAAFDAAKKRLATRLGQRDDQLDAGARIIGRYEDGRPHGLRDALPSVLPVQNGFVYNGDPPACPLGSHVRIVNPRTASTRSSAIARRGIPYGTRPDARAWSATDQLPEGGVGLLFMAYMSDIAGQYETIQLVANGGRGTEPDPLIGQRQTAPRGYDELIRLRGGGYFYTPSPSCLRAGLGRSIAQTREPTAPGYRPRPW